MNLKSYFLLLHIKGQIINKKSSLINVEELWQKKLTYSVKETAFAAAIAIVK